MPEMRGMPGPEEVARIKSEALAMRGLALFDLTRLFGMPYTLDNGASLGVPIEIQTEPWQIMLRNVTQWHNVTNKC